MTIVDRGGFLLERIFVSQQGWVPYNLPVKESGMLCEPHFSRSRLAFASSLS